MPPLPHPYLWIRQLAQDQEFSLMGICQAKVSPRTRFLTQWLDAGHHGEMGYLAQHASVRTDPRQLLPGAQSVICLADRYPSTTKLSPQAPAGKIARYAWGNDYHKVLKKRLFKIVDAMRKHWPHEQFRAVVDTAPILEREQAAAAGLGWIGKNTMLIHPRLGSWLLLGEIVSTLPPTEISRPDAPEVSRLQAPKNSEASNAPDAPEMCLPTSSKIPTGNPEAPFFSQPTSKKASAKTSAPHAVPMTDHCGTCTRCLEACPTQCLTPYEMDARRCISYLTLEHRTAIDPAYFSAIGDWLAGCDICQEVCPHNRPRQTATQPKPTPIPSETISRTHADELLSSTLEQHYQPRPPAPALNLLQVLNWNTQSRTEDLRGSAIKRMKLPMAQRNALIVAGNYLAQHHHPDLLNAIKQKATDPREDPMVQQTARQILTRLHGAGSDTH